MAKAAVCKTVIPRFKSGCRLQIVKGAAIIGLPPFFMEFRECAWIDPGMEITFALPFPRTTVVIIETRTDRRMEAR